MDRGWLFRQDIRDLSRLTVAKMDNYLIINTLQLGFSQAPRHTPFWQN